MVDDHMSLTWLTDYSFKKLELFTRSNHSQQFNRNTYHSGIITSNMLCWREAQIFVQIIEIRRLNWELCTHMGAFQ